MSVAIDQRQFVGKLTLRGENIFPQSDFFSRYVKRGAYAAISGLFPKFWAARHWCRWLRRGLRQKNFLPV